MAFAERGAQVWACDIVADELAETGELCRAKGGKCETRVVDVSQREQVNALVAEAFAATGQSKQVEELVHKSGIN